MGEFGSGSKTNEHEDSNWDTCVAIYQIQEAFVNYSGLSQQTFPYDHTPVTIHRCLVKYHWVKMVIVIKKRIAVICCFFEDVMKDNANRAVNDLPPLDFPAVEAILVNRIQKAGVAATIPLAVDAEPEREKQQQQPNQGNSYNSNRGRGRGGRGGGRGGRARGGRGGRGGARGNESKAYSKAKFEGLLTCFDFNNKAACENKSVGNNKCEKGGEWFVHKCNVYIDEKDAHCLMNHSRREHHRLATGNKS